MVDNAVVVKWSACSHTSPTIRVRIPLKSAVFSVKFLFEKRPRCVHFLKNHTVDTKLGPLVHALCVMRTVRYNDNVVNVNLRSFFFLILTLYIVVRDGPSDGWL